MFLIVMKRNNYMYVKKYLTITDHIQTTSDKKLCRRFAEQYLRFVDITVAEKIILTNTPTIHDKKNTRKHVVKALIVNEIQFYNQENSCQNSFNSCIVQFL